ncbi:hypothetical protein PR003_g17528 [Phytophthora rubi]|uniref:Uncharacterized protein n=1 Tax=Phytophthora rubi TaxID=129364 RepID=A0A6A4EM23_9STRA|nr:hypothetical protein PR003_g17528 [Phytophthora rubi]
MLAVSFGLRTTLRAQALREILVAAEFKGSCAGATDVEKCVIADADVEVAVSLLILMLSSPEGTVSLLMLTPNGALSLQMLILSSADATVSMLMLSSNGALSLLPTKGVLSLLLSAKVDVFLLMLS